MSLAELKRTVIVNSLRSCQLFTGLPMEDLEKVADVTVVKTLEKGDYLFHEGDLAHGFYRPAECPREFYSPRTLTMRWVSTHQTFRRRQRIISAGQSEVVLACCNSGKARNASGRR